MSGLVGSFAEAWAEVRVHRARVVLSLVGVVLAVFAMTVVTAAGILVSQVVQESTERSSGRSTTLSVYLSSQDGTAATPEMERFSGATVQRYGVEYSSRVLQGWVGAPDGSTGTQVTAVDPDYGVIHRVVPSSGRWLAAGDAERLLPAVVVNQAFLAQSGTVDRPAPFSATIPGTDDQHVVVVGTTLRDEWGPVMWTTVEDAGAFGIDPATSGGSALELWVPPDRADALSSDLRALATAEGLRADVQVFSDPSLGKVLTALQLVILGLSLFALFLGSLGVLNVGLVTVRQRVREIGVRRALGASSSRIFAAVMLESVVATVLAGLVGIAAAVALVSNVPLELLPAELAITDDPPFPWAAAVQAFVAATAVGAAAGLFPALLAVRTRVIDAIRY